MSFTIHRQRARKKHRPHGVTDKALNDALERAGAALEALRARHADGGLPLLRLPKPMKIWWRSAKLPAAGEGATDIVFLGTGGSSLGGQTLAQLAGHAVPGVGALRSARACISWTISMPTRSARCSASCRTRRRGLSRFRNPAAPPKR